MKLEKRKPDTLARTEYTELDVPADDGKDSENITPCGIRGACSCCFSLYDLHQDRIALDAAQREFIRRAASWARSREPRRKRAEDATEEPKPPQSESAVSMGRDDIEYVST